MRTIVIVAFSLLLISASAFATETRTMVMGDNNMIMVDDANMLMFPGRVYNYPNLALGEFSDSEQDCFYNVGITWQFNDDNPWVLGTFVSTSPSYLPTDYAGRDLAGFEEYGEAYFYDPNGDEYPMPTAAAINPDELLNPRRVNLMYGRRLGSNNFGFSLDVVRGSAKYDQDSVATPVPLDETHAEASFNQFTFGLGLTEGVSGQWDVALKFMTGSWKFKNWEQKDITEPDGYYDLSLAGRYFMVRSPKVTLVPHVAFTVGKHGVKDYTNNLDSTYDDSNYKFSRTGFDFGVGMNYTTGPDMLAVIDFGFMMNSIKGEYDEAQFDGTDWTVLSTEEKETYVSFPYMKLGFEGKVFKWMDVRAGGTATLWTSKEKLESDWSTDYTVDVPWNETYLGLGMHFGKLHLDTYMDPEIVLDGFNFISGSNDAENLNFRVSMLYELF